MAQTQFIALPLIEIPPRLAQDGFSWVTPTLLRCDEHAVCGVVREME